MKKDAKGNLILEYQGNRYDGTQSKENEMQEWAEAVQAMKHKLSPKKNPKPPEEFYIKQGIKNNNVDALIYSMRHYVESFRLE